MDDYEFAEGPEPAHEFEQELRGLVIINYEFALKGIAKSEDDSISPEDDAGFVSLIVNEHEDLRTAARNLALVGLVTRFQHWIIYLANLCRTEQMHGRSLMKELKDLHDKFPEVTNELEFFEELVNVRDSIVHADSRADWMHQYERHVAPKYRLGDRVEFTEAHLTQAIQKAIYTIGWYENYVTASRPSGLIFPKS